MLTWFACAIESGRMTVQGEHEQDGEDGVSPSLDEVYAERNKVVLAFAALVKEQGWDVGLTVDPSSPDWPVLMIETDAGQVSWHFQAGELPPGLPLFAGKWDGHSTPEKYARLAELVRSAFGLSREIAQDGDRWSAANCESCHKLGRPCGVHMRLGGRAQDGDTYA